MIRVLIIFCLLGVSQAFATEPPQAWLDVKHPLRNLSNKPVKLDDYKGPKGTLVIFSSNICPYVKKWMKRMVKAANRAQSSGFGVAMINSNDPEAYPGESMKAMKALKRSEGMNFAYIQDPTSKVARQFGATRTPEVFLYDSKGQLAYRGAIDDSYKIKDLEKHYLQDALTALLAGKPVAKSSSRSIGCTIKFRDGA